MAEPMMLSLVQQALVLALYAALPPLLLGGLAGALVDFAQSRLRASDPTLPLVARLVVGLLTLLVLAPRLGHELARFATSLWTALPWLGR